MNKHSMNLIEDIPRSISSYIVKSFTWPIQAFDL